MPHGKDQKMATTTTSTPTTSSSSSTPKPNSNLLDHHFSMSSTSPSSMKLKTLVHTLIFSHICRMARALSNAKSILSNILKDINFLDNLVHFNKGRSTKHYKHKRHKVKVYGSFRLHYNWCSSSAHILPEPDLFCPSQLFYYDSTWNSVASTGVKDCGVDSKLGLSGYLQWLEEKPDHIDPIDQDNLKKAVDDLNEIDKLADVFIASCHEKFRLEKQESYRRFQEMMARSV